MAVDEPHCHEKFLAMPDMQVHLSTGSAALGLEAQQQMGTGFFDNSGPYCQPLYPWLYCRSHHGLVV